jgi:hypothetical protein
MYVRMYVGGAIDDAVAVLVAIKSLFNRSGS